jgi:hypothetical protein
MGSRGTDFIESTLKPASDGSGDLELEPSCAWANPPLRDQRGIEPAFAFPGRLAMNASRTRITSPLFDWSTSILRRPLGLIDDNMIAGPLGRRQIQTQLFYGAEDRWS